MLFLNMKLEIWSDVACPWCYVGKRRLDLALSRFEQRDEVDVVWRSFELDPRRATPPTGTYVDRLAAKYRTSVPQAQAMIDRMVDVGRQNGIVFDFDTAKPANTFDAHRLLHLALHRGFQESLEERLFAARFTEGQAVDDLDVLVSLAIDVGLDGEEARTMLEGDAFSDAVRADEQRAAMLGISSVPFFVIDGRYGVAGAQSPEVLLQALEEAWSTTRTTQAGTPNAVVASGDDACSPVS